MHEEPYTQALLDLALREAGGRRIVAIRLGVGQFSAIVAGAVEVFFRHLSAGTPAQGARLVFETVPLELTCTACGRTSGLDGGPDAPVRPALAAALRRGCPCGGARLTITGGLGFDLLGLTVEGGDS
jgi:hydrogenase nickel incorporation protein HypA/HybF